MPLKKFFKPNPNVARRKTNNAYSKRVHISLATRWFLILLLGWGTLTIGGFFPNVIFASTEEPTNPLKREYAIQVDPTALTPPTWWHVPGVTPLIWSLDPISSDAYQTTEARTLSLKPGEYRFGTYTFNFSFTITLKGTLDYRRSLDQCVHGRGTKTLTIMCSHTQPYPQEPEYIYSPN